MVLLKSNAKALTAEALGTGLLLSVVVGSGIMAERLSGGNTAVALLANALATGAGLIAFILALGPVSGAHFNPVVTVSQAFDGRISWGRVPGYIAAQTLGAFAGTAAADFMFGLPLFSASTHPRTGASQWFSEFVATFGLLLVIRGCSQGFKRAVPFAVAAYIVAAYWFTASTSFANPAVTLARTVSDTFAGIRPVDAPGFILAQITAAAISIPVLRWLMPESIQMENKEASHD
jgi:glycerol uptake facilitator-like aquaporin